MNTYVFIFGNHPKLSFAELQSVYPSHHIGYEDGNSFAILLHENFDCIAAMRRLGGTVKIGRLMGDSLLPETLAQALMKEKPEGKIVFGISDYDKISKIKSQSFDKLRIDPERSRMGQISKLSPQRRDPAFLKKNISVAGQFKIKKLGIDIKRILGEQGRKARFVTSREAVLSSVVITKNKCLEFIVAGGKLFRTCAVQEFEEYSFRDYGRPARDARAGILPPKLAKIMINLSRAKPDDALLDPFCGSGTILQEAILLGYKKLTGSDISQKAVEDTKKNIEWLSKNIQYPISNIQLFREDVKELSKHIKNVDAIITEPYLGPPIRSRESSAHLKNIMKELSHLYISAFQEFKKILKPRGTVVIIFPVFRLNREDICLDIKKEIISLGFRQIEPRDLVYARRDQRVAREIVLWYNESYEKNK